MPATGCTDPTCVWSEGQYVGYCLDCGRAMGCICGSIFPDGPGLVKRIPVPECPAQHPGS